MVRTSPLGSRSPTTHHPPPSPIPGVCPQQHRNMVPAWTTLAEKLVTQPRRCSPFLVPAAEGWAEVPRRQAVCLHTRLGCLGKATRGVVPWLPALLGHLPLQDLSLPVPTPGMVIIIHVIIIGTQQNSGPRMLGLGTTLPSENKNDPASWEQCNPGSSFPPLPKAWGVWEGDRKGTEALRGQPDKRPKPCPEGAT